MWFERDALARIEDAFRKVEFREGGAGPGGFAESMLESVVGGNKAVWPFFNWVLVEFWLSRLHVSNRFFRFSVG